MLYSPQHNKDYEINAFNAEMFSIIYFTRSLDSSVQ